MEDSRSAAVREVMLDRERAAMVAEDRSSYIAQRHFVGSQQEPNSHVHPMPWREAYMVRSTDMMRAREVMRASLMVLRRASLGGGGTYCFFFVCCLCYVLRVCVCIIEYPVYVMS